LNGERTARSDVNVAPFNPNDPSTASTRPSVYAIRAVDNGGQSATAASTTGVSRGKSARSGTPPSDQRPYRAFRRCGLR
jgi:hypothetical protein